jgi:hypothetical protein
MERQDSGRSGSRKEMIPYHRSYVPGRCRTGCTPMLHFSIENNKRVAPSRFCTKVSDTASYVGVKHHGPCGISSKKYKNMTMFHQNVSHHEITS